MSRRGDAVAVQPSEGNKASGSTCLEGLVGEGEGRRRGAGIWREGKEKGTVWVLSGDVMKLAENTSLLLECKQ